MALPYVPTNWLSGDIVSSARLNKLEGGVKENSDAILGNTADINDLKSEINEVEAGFPQKSASGSIVTINDGADNVPVVSLTADIDPVQDLHGYESPWPAGGGKNLAGLTYGNKVPSTSTGEMVSANGWSTDFIPVDNTKTYFQSSVLDVATYVMLYDSSKGYLGYVQTSSYPNKTYGLATNEHWSSTAYVKCRSDASSTQDTKLMLEQSASATSYAPYSNECPISGFTEVDVSVTGVNVWDEVWENGYYNATTGLPVENANYVRSKNPIPVKPSTVYRFVIGNDIAGTTGNTANILFYDINGDYISYVSHYKSSGLAQTFTTPANAAYVKFYMTDYYGAVYRGDISINYPATDTSYHAYNGSVTPIEFPDSAGTVYGGSIRLNQDGTADLTVTHGGVDMGSLNWAYTNSTFYADVTGKAHGNDILCSAYKVSNATGFYVLDYEIGGGGSNSYVYVKDPNYTDAATFKAAMSGQTLVFELETPQTYHIENVELVKTLYGLNNIWADTGDISLVYRADPATFTSEQIRIMLNAMVAPVEAATTASKPYVVNEFLIYNNTLYKVISPIANGGTITPNTNVSATTVGEQLTAILNA